MAKNILDHNSKWTMEIQELLHLLFEISSKKF